MEKRTKRIGAPYPGNNDLMLIIHWIIHAILIQYIFILTYFYCYNAAILCFHIAFANAAAIAVLPQS